MQHTFTRWLFLFISLAVTSVAFAQTDRTAVYLRSGILTPQENLRDFLSYTPRPAELVNGSMYRLIQFHDIPNEADRLSLAGEGIDLLDYYPYNTWLASIPANASKAVLSETGVRSVFPLPAEAKIHDFIREANYPDYLWEGDRLVLIVQVPANLSPSFAMQAIRTLGIETGNRLPDGNQFFVKARPDQVSLIASQPYVLWLEGNPDPGEPEDLRALALHRSNGVSSDHPMGRHYNGSGVNVQVRDDGGIGPHIDFTGRTNQASTGGPGGGTHGDMVAGVFAGGGNLDPTTRGAAWGSFIYVTQYEPTYTDNTLSLHQNNGVMITNSSYSNGCNAGYTTITQRVDQQIFSNPSLLHMFSAGNSNNQNCGYGAGDQWGNITGGHKQGKNVIAVANLLPDGTLVNSSSRGPAHDGRIKPDVAANGNEQMSTDPFNTYLPGGGTSAASPSTAGVIAQLYQAYKVLQGNGNNPPSALIKAIVLNTAEDYGNRGPDFRFGWGRINGLRAVKTIEDERYFTGTVSQGGTNTHNIEVPPGVIALKVMTYWMDPPSTPGTNLALINDIDSRITGPGGLYFPWVLDHTADAIRLNVPATKGLDRRNNMEQVQIDNPQAGTHTLTVSGFSIPQGPQQYYVVVEYITEEIEVTHPIGGEGFAPAEPVTIHWDAFGNFGPFAIHYSIDNGATWKLIDGNISGGLRAYTWTAPSTITGQAKIRVSRGNNVGISAHPFSIVGVPAGLEIVQVCNTTMTLTWDKVQGAAAYDVFLLGNAFMDSIGTTTDLSFAVPITSPFNENWVSVRARTADNTPGRRAIAISNSIGPITCSTGNDLRAVGIPAIASGSLPGCTDTVRMAVEILNSGSTPQTGFTVGYQVTGSAAVTTVYNGTIQPGQLITVPFPGGYAPATGVAQSILVKGFVGPVVADPVGNDTSYQTLQIANSGFINGAFTQDFEAFGTCATTFDCGGTICPLGNGWINEINGIADDHDWRVNSGGTPSNNTGPSSDHNPGTFNGKYLYLESSNGCNATEAILTSPCIDVSQMLRPTLSVWYHMYGESMGTLNVDVFDGENWNTGIASISGDQGNEWKELLVDLTDYSGSFVSFRIRGITGSSFTSDMAIDDISVFDGVGVPVAAFDVTKQEVCPGDEVNLLDLSQFSPESWEWSIAPSTVTYLSGSNASSSSPMLSFDQNGQYDVTLVVENAFGKDSLTKTIYVTASAGRPLPVSEDFETFVFPPDGWVLDNPDEDVTWTRVAVTGADATLTGAAQVNNYIYPSTGQEDLLNSVNIDLRTAVEPWLSFDVAYGARSISHYDELRVVISDNCGQSFLYPVYQKAQTDLQTAGLVGGPFFPNNAGQWRKDSLDLSAFVGQTIAVGFVNMTGGGNAVYLDNILIRDKVTIDPIAYTVASAQEICVGELFTLSDTSAGNNLVYNWSLGTGATPFTRGFDGQFDATFSTPGLKTIYLTVSNAGGSSTDSVQVMVRATPEANFVFDISGGFQTYAFDNQSTDAQTFQWDFGDGTTSQDSLPTHTFTQNGSYTVTLTVAGLCGTDTMTAQVEITNVAIEGQLGGLSLRAFPNPVRELLTIEASGNQATSLTVELTDLRGRSILSESWDVQQNLSKKTIRMDSLPEGVYLLSIRGESGQLIRRVIVR